ncbi:hypothetical protein [Cupriavidus sp. DL-D2]|uniref:hypothetical protein n=1 Tax=Cupriavidus sp. DL-D2 TaxID=3144974 RepID=UPI003215C9A9
MSRSPTASPTARAIAKAIATATIAMQRSVLSGGRSSPENELSRLEASPLAGMILRATTDPANTSDASFGGLVQETVTLDFVTNLPNASARLFALAGIRASATVKSRFVGRITDFIDGYGWVAEAAPIPVASMEFSSGTPFVMGKLALITTLTQELATSTDGVSILSTLLLEDAAGRIDKNMLGNAAATAYSPAGLLNGVTALPGSADGKADLGALFDAVPKLQRGLLLMTSRRLLSVDMLQVRNPSDGRLGGAEIVLTSQIPDDAMILLDVQDLAVAGDTAPTIDTRADGAVVMASPAVPFADATGTVGQPITSLMQQELMAMRSRVGLSWAMRREDRIAEITGCTW